MPDVVQQRCDEQCGRRTLLACEPSRLGSVFADRDGLANVGVVAMEAVNQQDLVDDAHTHEPAGLQVASSFLMRAADSSPRNTRAP